MGSASVRPARLSRPGCVIHYRRRESTSGRWVVFLHGASMDGAMFDAQLAAVPDEVGIACWDARGHGRSCLSGPFRFGDMLADLHALVGTLDAQELVLIGQSMGGNLAQAFVDDAPGTVDRLVLIDCTANHGLLSALERLALRSTRLVLSAYPWGVAVRQSARACGTSPATMAYAQQCLRRMGKARFVEVMGFWRQALDPDPSYRFLLPVLGLIGDHDTSGNIPTAMNRLAQQDPNVHLETIVGAGHNSNMDQPDQVNTAILRFATDPR